MLKDVHSRLDIKYDSHTLQAARRGHLVDDEDAEAFDNEEGDGPTLSPFKPFWSVPKSAWNVALGNLLVSDLISQNPQLAPDEAELLEIFLQRLKVMKGCIRDSLEEPGETPEATEIRVQQALAEVNRAKRIQGRQRTVSCFPHHTSSCLTMLVALFYPAIRRIRWVADSRQGSLAGYLRYDHNTWHRWW